MLNEILLLCFIECGYYILKLIIYFNHTNLTKWFYTHSIMNFFICIYSIDDIIVCLNNISSCYLIQWNNNSYITYKLSLLLHIYHLLFYKITKSDLIHHLIMCGICGPLIYYENNIISSVSLFFMCGLPGMIDYFTLFLVKINKIKIKTQKKNYIYISIWIRSPGCLLSVFLSIPCLIHYYNISLIKFMMSFTMSLIVFWNGQYYLMKTINDYLIKYTEKVQLQYLKM